MNKGIASKIFEALKLNVSGLKLVESVGKEIKILENGADIYHDGNCAWWKSGNPFDTSKGYRVVYDATWAIKTWVVPNTNGCEIITDAWLWPDCDPTSLFKGLSEHSRYWDGIGHKLRVFKDLNDVLDKRFILWLEKLVQTEGRATTRDALLDDVRPVLGRKFLLDTKDHITAEINNPPYIGVAYFNLFPTIGGGG